MCRKVIGGYDLKYPKVLLQYRQHEDGQNLYGRQPPSMRRQTSDSVILALVVSLIFKLIAQKHRLQRMSHQRLNVGLGRNGRKSPGGAMLRAPLVLQVVKYTALVIFGRKLRWPVHRISVVCRSRIE